MSLCHSRKNSTVAVGSQVPVDSICASRDSKRNSRLVSCPGTLKKATTWSMRFAKKFYLLLLFSLTLGLFFGELPESFSLSDDVSNDFVEESAAPVSSGVEIARADLISEQSPYPTEQPFVLREPAGIPTPPPKASSGPNLLRLLSIQRK
jgi:hypothetical protein